MYVILFITYHRYHSLSHLKTTAIEIQGIKIIKKNETRRREAEVDNEISRGNNLLYHPLSYVLFI
jgi:arginine deiminase